MNSNDRLWWCLCLAILLHWLLARLPPPQGGDRSRTTAEQNKPIEITPYPSAKQPIVRTSRAKEDPDAKDKKADYAGEFRNRVKKETRSPIHGRFSEGRPPTARPESETQSEKGGSRQLSMTDLMNFGATPNELSKEIQEGNETVLNTDSVKYASFINRIADAIYDPWTRNVRSAMQDIALAGRKLEPTSYITRLEVELDHDGKVLSIATLHSSGVNELDEATKKAFWGTEPFQNPPEGLFDKNGELKFVFEFQLMNSSFSIVPPTI